MRRSPGRCDFEAAPPEKRTAYFEAALGHVADGSMTTLDRVQRPPKSRDPYVEFTDHDNYDTATF